MFSNLIKRWEIKASTGNHFDVLDGLRGIAILMVVAYHALSTNPNAGAAARWAGYLISSGWMGVPIFFVLSGFLISYPFFKRRQTDPSFWYQRGYAARRIGKILPPFYLSILIFIVFYWLERRDPADWDTAWKWATGLANWVYVPPNFNNSYWSLLVESHFYFMLPLLFWLTRGRSLRSTTLIIALILFLVPLMVRSLTYSELPIRFDSMSRFPCKLDYFGWGVVFAGMYVGLALVRSKLRRLSRLGNIGCLLLVATMFFWHRIPVWNSHGAATRQYGEWTHWLPGLASVLLLFFLYDPGCLMARWIANGVLRFIGIVSYEWFLFQGPVITFFHDHIEPGHGSFWRLLGRSVVPAVLTLGLSIMVYRWFSLPILKGIRGGVEHAKPS